MTDETKEALGFYIAVIGMALIASSLTHMATDWSWRRQIAGHHCAEFYIDQSNYRQWHWIDCNKP